ncbi:hypothetical protein EK904_014831 [Melospiza melodia maxima]|nr:hypothetical protein EK904_014831 [Melospiza melodia maxima]
MGIGLFIFICANTMLYENRDMETRQLMQKGLYSLAHPAASPAASLRSLRSTEANLSLPRGAGAESLLSSAVGALTLPIIKLNNCLLDGAARGAGGRAQRGPAEHPPKTSQLSIGGSTAPCGRDADGGGGHVVVSMGDGCPGMEPLVELSPDVHLHTPGHSKSLDLGRPGVLLVAPIKDRKNRSWPRLDHVSLVGYAKLESSGESSDQLLEPSECPGQGQPLPSSWVVGMEQGTRV